MEIKNLEKMKERLFDKRFLLVDDNIDKGGSDEFIEKLFLLSLDKKDPVNVIIRTGGGSVEPGLGMYDALKSCPAETNAYVLTRCHSTGIAVLAGCSNHRIGLENSRYLFHSMRTRLTVLWPHPYGVSQEEQVRQELEKGAITFEKLRKTSIENFKITADMYKKLCEDGEISNTGITAEKALELGMLTEVWDGKKEKWFWEKLLS